MIDLTTYTTNIENNILKKQLYINANIQQSVKMVDIPVLYINRKLVGQLNFAYRKKIETKTIGTGKPISLNRIDYGKSKIEQWH